MRWVYQLQNTQVGNAEGQNPALEKFYAALGILVYLWSVRSILSSSIWKLAWSVACLLRFTDYEVLAY